MNACSVFVLVPCNHNVFFIDIPYFRFCWQIEKVTILGDIGFYIFPV